MAGRFDFQSPFAAMSEAMVQALAERKALARQKMMDEIQARNIESQMEDRAVNRDIQRENVENTRVLRRNQTADRISSVLSPGQEIDQPTGDALRGGGMGALVLGRPATIQDIEQAPAVPVAPETEDMQGAPVPSMTFRGTAEQVEEQDDRARLEQYVASLDPESDEARALTYQLHTGENAPAGMFNRQASKPSSVAEYEYYVEQTKASGGQPMSFEEYQNADANRKQTAAGGENGRPYFLPVQTGQGIIPFDARTGQFNHEGRQDLKPGETAQVDLTKAQSTLYQLDELGQVFTPERVGPLTGRYKNMQLLLVGELGDQGLAEMQATISTLQNTVINLRTGAQMSEPEAHRILNEVPNLNLPPDVFLARMNRAKEYFADWMARRARFAFGRNTTGDVDAMISGAPAPGASRGAPPPARTPNAGGAKPAPVDPLGIR